MARHTMVQDNLQGDLFLSPKSRYEFDNKALNNAIRYYEVKEQNIMASKLNNDWLTAWQMKNEK